jgi:hypothetical protein
VSADREPTAAEVLEWRRDDVFLPEAQQPLRSFRLCVTSRPDSSSAFVVRPLGGCAGVRDALDVSDRGRLFQPLVVHEGDEIMRVRVAEEVTLSPDNFDLDLEFEVDVTDVRESIAALGGGFFPETRTATA